jgi:hypothetical protein
MSNVGHTWKLWAQRFENGTFWHVGARRWVALHGLSHPIVSVLVEEILSDPYAPEVTHYGWQYAEDSPYRHSDTPAMIQIRTGSEPPRARMLLNMCFPYGLDAAISKGDGQVVALRITERKEEDA